MPLSIPSFADRPSSLVSLPLLPSYFPLNRTQPWSLLFVCLSVLSRYTPPFPSTHSYQWLAGLNSRSHIKVSERASRQGRGEEEAEKTRRVSSGSEMPLAFSNIPRSHASWRSCTGIQDTGSAECFRDMKNCQAGRLCPFQTLIGSDPAGIDADWELEPSINPFCWIFFNLPNPQKPV